MGLKTKTTIIVLFSASFAHCQIWSLLLIKTQNYLSFHLQKKNLKSETFHHKDVVLVARLEAFRVLKLSRLENIRALIP